MRADILLEKSNPALLADASQLAWSHEEFEVKLRERGRSYHIHHPFNVMLNSGCATPEQVRGWVANRFYYQIAIPIKDAAWKSTPTGGRQTISSWKPWGP